MSTGGRSSTGKVSNPSLAGSPVARGDEAAEPGHLNREQVALARLVGHGDQHLRGGLLALPARLDRGELGRLVLEHVIAGEMAKKQLHRDDYCDQAEPPVQHDAGFGRLPAAQQIPGAGSDNAHPGGQEGGQQHMRPAHHHRPARATMAHQSVRNDLAVDHRVADRHLHP